MFLHFNHYYDKKTTQLSGDFTRQTVLDVTQILSSYRCPFSLADCVPAHERLRFLALLQRRYHNDAAKRAEFRNWETWSVVRYCKELKEAVPDVTETQAMIMGFFEAISRVKVNFDLQDLSLEEETESLLCDIKESHPSAQELNAVAILQKRLPDTPTNWRGILTKNIGEKAPILDRVEVFRFTWLQQLKLCREHIATANLMGGICTYGSSSRQYSPQSV